MRADEVKEQLESLRSEVQDMGRALHQLRSQDVIWVFGEQIRPVLEEKVRRYFNQMRKMSNDISASDLAKAENMLIDLVHEVVSCYQNMGRDKALVLLAERNAKIVLNDETDVNMALEGILPEIEEQIRLYFDVSLELDGQLRFATNRATDITAVPEAVRPIDVERALSSLGNAIRFELMISLRKRNMGLTELSRLLGLQKGHLQFHIKSLVESGFIKMDTRTRQYSLTRKGGAALAGTEELVRKIGSIN